MSECWISGTAFSRDGERNQIYAESSVTALIIDELLSITFAPRTEDICAIAVPVAHGSADFLPVLLAQSFSEEKVTALAED